MIHSKDEVLKLSGIICDNIIALEADVVKEMGFNDAKCDEFKYRLADIVAMARCVTADLGDDGTENT